jgi:hypothetical protein
MQGRDSYQDELARRRAEREQQARGKAQVQAQARESAEAADAPAANADSDDLPQFGWKDILAMVIAAYQILFPFLAVLIGAMLIGYLIFRFAFH